MELALVEMLLAVVGLGGLAVWLYALVDVLRRPQNVWVASRQSQLVWVVVVVFLSLMGALVYLAVAKRALDRAAADLRTPVTV